MPDTEIGASAKRKPCWSTTAGQQAQNQTKVKLMTVIEIDYGKLRIMTTQAAKGYALDAFDGSCGESNSNDEEGFFHPGHGLAKHLLLVLHTLGRDQAGEAGCVFLHELNNLRRCAEMEIVDGMTPLLGPLVTRVAGFVLLCAGIAGRSLQVADSPGLSACGFHCIAASNHR